MKHIISILGATAIAVSGFAIAYAKDKKPEAQVRAVGQPKSCVNLRNIRSTKIIDSRTIEFKMAGGKTYRNTMPYSCPSLKFEERFSYRTSQNSLCNVDIIHVLHNYGGGLQQGAGCGLGKFQQVEPVNPAS